MEIICYFIYPDNPKPVPKKLNVFGGQYHYEGRQDFNGEFLPNVRVWDNGALIDPETNEIYIAKGEEPLYFKISNPKEVT